MAPMKPAGKSRVESLGPRRGGVGIGNENGRRKTWRPNYSQGFVGSVREGQGFAFRRKLKIQKHYRKLQWKEKKSQLSQESQFTDHYPDHLKHLYLAEEERLRKQQRRVEHHLSKEAADQPVPEEDSDTDQTLPKDLCGGVQQLPPEEQDSQTVHSVTFPKKNKKKTSNQKAKEEYEQIQAKRAAKKQEFERRKQEREEAQRLYKKKKMEMFKILSKKTKKGQPNLNLQMEYLLQKIQEKS
ncbi:thyroid transcription factor 1-associated protein 26 [Perognathus longimembris pacificus]|uniref:thyroid transcription factor 1-associated protein 26 n=1 Tax=Perognathus longimembris pacificus TaxID=214514 RepID=UPI002018D55A|nr:thyroid transcription factor 1-associated protein 26 [Perognathus longimembris pacificus]